MNPLNINRVGQGPKKLVAIHGLGSASTAWKLLSTKLNNEYQLITLDLPGHGDSLIMGSKEMTPEKLGEIVKETLDAEGIKEFHLLGNSLGGWVALEMAAKYPDSVQSVTALAPAGLWLQPRTGRNFSLDLSRFLARIFYRYANSFVKFKFIRAIGFGLMSPKWRELSFETCVDAAVAMGSAPGYNEIWSATFGQRFDKPISEKIPVTIIFGDSDNTLPARDCQERSLAPKHTNWIVLKESGHAPMWDQVNLVNTWINQTTSIN